MSRYRPPVAPGSSYITPAGHARLKAELDQLWRVERPQVTTAVSAAAAQGDRSENAEYTYGKKRLREIDSRVRFLRRRLDGMMVVDQPPADPQPGVLRRLGDDRPATMAPRAATASSDRTNSTWSPATSAWTRRWRARCSARRWTRKSTAVKRYDRADSRYGSPRSHWAWSAVHEARIAAGACGPDTLRPPS